MLLSVCSYIVSVPIGIALLMGRRSREGRDEEQEEQYRLRFDAPIDEFPRIFVEADVPAAEDHAVCLDGLAKDGEGRWGVGGFDFFDGGGSHGC